MSMVSLHATVLEVCDYVYGDSEMHTSLDDVDRFYESGAGECSRSTSYGAGALTIPQCEVQFALVFMSG
jgi:hypothetical protein